MKKIFGLMAVTMLVAAALTGCGTVGANQILQHKNSGAIQARAVPGGAGVGVDLFNLGAIQSWTDAGIQTLGAAFDAATIITGIKLYQRANDSGPSVTLPSTISTGNRSPVVINTGNGSPYLYIPTTTSTDSHNGM